MTKGPRARPPFEATCVPGAPLERCEDGKPHPPSKCRAHVETRRFVLLTQKSLAPFGPQDAAKGSKGCGHVRENGVGKRGQPVTERPGGRRKERGRRRDEGTEPNGHSRRLVSSFGLRHAPGKANQYRSHAGASEGVGVSKEPSARHLRAKRIQRHLNGIEVILDDQSPRKEGERQVGGSRPGGLRHYHRRGKVLVFS